MKIIISPAKKMRDTNEVFVPASTPAFLAETTKLLSHIKTLSYEDCKRMWKCNDAIAALNYDRYQCMELSKQLVPALFSYEGIQYQYMGPMVLDQESLDYLQNHLCILSGFYGVVKPFDGIVPYRLEMQSKLIGYELENLYTFWGDALAKHVYETTDVVLNLASKEYSKCIQKYLPAQGKMVTCIFGEYKGEKVVEKGTQAKMARGAMVRYLAENKVTSLEYVKNFSHLGYVYHEILSTPDQYVFIKETSVL